VRAGDVVVQRGTNHGWANRSGRNCRIAFILIDGRFVGGLAPEVSRDVGSVGAAQHHDQHLFPADQAGSGAREDVAGTAACC